MKAIQTFRALILVAGLSAASLAFAHHAGAGADRTKQVTLTGSISAVEWVNPHMRIRIDVKNEQGKTESWDLGWGAPSATTRSGLTKEMLKAGSRVTVQAFPSLPGTVVAGAETKTGEAGCILLDGQQFQGGHGPACVNLPVTK